MLKSLRFQLEFHFFPNNPLKFRRGKVSLQVNIPETHIKVLCSQNVIWGPEKSCPRSHCFSSSSKMVCAFLATWISHAQCGFQVFSAVRRSLNINGTRVSGSKHDTGKVAKECWFSLWKECRFSLWKGYFTPNI